MQQRPQVPRRPPGLPDGLQQYPGVPLDVPSEFEFLYQGFIPSGELKATWAALPYESITLERSRCMGECPAYKVTLSRGSPAGQGRETYEDRFGRAELHATVSGQVFPEKSGDFTGRVDIWSYGRLCYLLSRQFSGLSDRYESGWSDQQTITVTVTASNPAHCFNRIFMEAERQLNGIDEEKMRTKGHPQTPSGSPRV